MANIIKMTIQFRRDTAANWELFKDIIPASGEPCFVTDQNILKIGDGITTFENLEPINGVKFDIAADGQSLILEDDVLKLMGFDDAEAGSQPRKNEDGFIEWVVPEADENMDGLLVEVDALRDDVTNLQTGVADLKEIVSPSGDGEIPLLTRIESIENKIDGTGEGTVDAKIDAKINEFVNKMSDDGVVNTLKELVDYVADHGTEAADLADDIIDLRGLVGDTKVSDQIATAVSGKVDAEEGKSLVSDDLIAKLEAISEGTQENTIETVKVGNTLLDIVEKTVVIPVGAGLKASEEITVAEDGTLGIGKISFSKVVQEDEDQEIVLSGGGAAG